MKHRHVVPKRTLLASALLLALGQPVYAQSTDQAQTTFAGDLYRVNELAWSGRRYFVSLTYKY